MSKSLFADENFPFPTVIHLREKGYNILTLQDIRQDGIGLSDEKILQIARHHQRAILTINRKDFIRLHKDNSSHYGIIVCKLDIDFSRLAKNIDMEIKDMSSLVGVLVKINR